jgi:hypothetical protein
LAIFCLALWRLADPLIFLLSARDRRLNFAINRFNGFAPVMTSPVERIASALIPKSTPTAPWFLALGICDLSSVSTLILAYHRLAVREIVADRMFPLNRKDSRIRTHLTSMLDIGRSIRLMPNCRKTAPCLPLSGNNSLVDCLNQRRFDDMAKVDWGAELKKRGGQAGMFSVYLCPENKRIEATVHATPLSEDKAAEARRRTQQTAAKKGRTPKQETLYLSGWVLVLTTVPTTILDTKTVAALDRLRWQVELVIKRLKSLLDIDCLRARKDSDLAELYLYGKLLYAAVIEKIATRRFKPSPTNTMQDRTLTPWRLWVLVASDVQSWLMRSMPARIKYAADAKKALCERPRKRKLQTLPK